MTARKFTVSLDPDVVDRAKLEVAEGRAESLSAWMNAAAQARLDSEEVAAVLADLFDATGGPVTDVELAEARERLAAVEPR